MQSLSLVHSPPALPLDATEGAGAIGAAALEAPEARGADGGGGWGGGGATGAERAVTAGAVGVGAFTVSGLGGVSRAHAATEKRKIMAARGGVGSITGECATRAADASEAWGSLGQPGAAWGSLRTSEES